MRRIEIATGDLQTAHGQFDPVLATSFDRGRSYNPVQAAQRPPDVFAAIQNVTSYSVNLQKQFASGLAIQPNLSMSRTDVDLSPRSTAVERSASISFSRSPGAAVGRRTRQ